MAGQNKRDRKAQKSKEKGKKPVENKKASRRPKQKGKIKNAQNAHGAPLWQMRTTPPPDARIDQEAQRLVRTGECVSLGLARRVAGWRVRKNLA